MKNGYASHSIRRVHHLTSAKDRSRDQGAWRGQSPRTLATVDPRREDGRSAREGVSQRSVQPALDPHGHGAARVSETRKDDASRTSEQALRLLQHHVGRRGGVDVLCALVTERQQVEPAEQVFAAAEQ